MNSGVTPIDENLEPGSPAPPPPLYPGDPAPWFRALSDVNPQFKFSTLGGRRIILSFLPSFSNGEWAAVFRDLMAGAGRFRANTTALILVTADREDASATVPASIEGVRYFFDFDRRIASLFVKMDGKDTPAISCIIDERMRIFAVIVARSPSEHAARVYGVFDSLPAATIATPAQLQAPVLMVPHIFEPDLCKALMTAYETNGGKESGFMVERDGMTVGKVDYGHKRRSDWEMTDVELIKACHTRIQRRLRPEITKAFQFDASRIERNTVARYDADTRGHFRPHRDNTTKGTAHRRFAVSINLNAEDYEGGDLVFPEFGPARFRPPTGGACVFSCSLLHAVTGMTRGTRYVYVPFLYDDTAAALRQRYRKFLAP